MPFSGTVGNQRNEQNHLNTEYRNFEWLKPGQIILLFVRLERTVPLGQVLTPRWLVVKASTSRAQDPGFDTHLCLGIFPGRVIPCSDLKIGAPAATLPGARRYRVIAGTGWPGASIL